MPRPIPGPLAGRFLILMVLAAAGCGELGAPATKPSLVEQSERTRESRAAWRYQKKAGLHLDAPYLLGREYGTLDPEVVADQLGKLQERTVDSRGEVSLRFDKTDVWLSRGRIYRVRYRFAAPMDRKTAWGVCGFPLEMGPPIDATVELRVNNYWGMRRISLLRVAPRSPLYKAIDIWKFFPLDQRR